MLFVENPSDTIGLINTCRHQIDLVLTDLMMPGMNGWTLANKVHNDLPGLPVVFMSGHTADIIGEHAIVEEEVHFISKPFTRESLARKVREVLDTV